MAEQRDVIWNLRTTVSGKEQAAQLADTIDRTDREYREAEQGAKRFSQATKEQGRSSAAAAQQTAGQAAQVNKLGLSVASAARNFLAFAGVGTVVGAATLALRDGIGTIIEFDQEIANLSALTGATGGDLDYLRERAIALGSATSLSANEVAQAFTKIASARPQLLEDADALNTVTEASIRLAEASGEDLVSATTAAVGALNQFGYESEEVNRIIDTLAAGSKFGAANVGNLGETINRVGTVLAGANIEIEQGVGIIETLAEREIKGAEAGTQLRNVLLRLQKEGKGFVDGQFDVVAALRQVKEEFDAIEDPVLRSEAAIKLFETRGITAGTILLENIDRIEEFTDKVSVSGIAAEQQATRMATLRGALDRLSSAWTGIVLSFSGGNNVLRRGIDFLARNLNTIFNLFRVGARTVVAYLVATRGLALAKVALTSIVRGAAVVQAFFTNGVYRAITATRILNATIKANPLGILIGLLTAAYSAYQLFVEGAKDGAEEQKKVNEELRKNLELRERLRTQDNSIDRRADQLSQLSKAQLEQLRADVDTQIEEYERLNAEAIGLEAAKARDIQDERERQVQLNQQLEQAAADATEATDKLLLDRLTANRDSAYTERRAKERALNSAITNDESAANLERLRAYRETIQDRIRALEALEKAEQDTLNGLLKRQQELQAKLKEQRIGSAEFFATNRDLTNIENRIEAAKRLLEGITKGSLADLQRQRDTLLKQLRQQLVEGSDEYQQAFAQYVELARKVKALEDNLQLPADQAVEGSINYFQQQVESLTKAIQGLPEGEEFNALAAQLAKAQTELDRLRERLKFESPEDRAKRLQEANLKELDEEKRHALALSELDDDRNSTRIALQLEFERQRLAILLASGAATEEEIRKQQNVLKELQLAFAKATREEGQDDLDTLAKLALDTADTIANAGINAWSSWSQASADALDEQLAQQRRRVDEAREIAERGNAALLEEESNRLRKLTEERRKAAEQQSAIAQAEVFANSAVAIARAAAEGGGFASAITISATVIALLAGLARARQLSSGLSFRKGGLFDGVSSTGGYTGWGNPDAVSTTLGQKPYTYHKREFIMPHEVVSVGNNLQWLDRIYRGRIDMDKMFAASPYTVSMTGMSDTQVRRMEGALRKAPGVNVMLDRNGFSVYLGNQQRRERRRSQRR